MRFLFLLTFLNSAFSAVYDCFIFFNELELLEVRFSELYNVVDQFVLVESSKTFKGTPKSLFFEENRHRFAFFLDKVIHIVVDLPLSHSEEERSEYCNYLRENLQRDAILQGLKNCSDEDIIFISDVDEIWRASSLPYIRQKLESREYDTMRLSMRMYRYFLDRLDTYTPYWNGAGAATYGHLKTMTPTEFRGVITGWWADWTKHRWPGTCLNAGWHFTYMGGYGKVKDKIRAFSHVEDSHPHFRTDVQSIDQNVLEWTCQVRIDQTYPQYIQTYKDQFRENGFIYD